MHIKRSTTPSSDSSDTRSPKKARSSTQSPAKGSKSPNPKARLSKEAKTLIAQEIISQGAAYVDVDMLAEKTGLTKQQIRSQIVDNRQNIRKQLLEMAKALQ